MHIRLTILSAIKTFSFLLWFVAVVHDLLAFRRTFARRKNLPQRRGAKSTTFMNI